MHYIILTKRFNEVITNLGMYKIWLAYNKVSNARNISIGYSNLFEIIFRFKKFNIHCLFKKKT